MKKTTKPILKLRIQYEFAYEVIYISMIIILVGMAYLFASNLLTFNWYTVFFGLLALLLIYLKYQSFLMIENDSLTITYGKFIKQSKIDMKTVDDFVFFEQERLIEIKSNGKVIATLYLKRKNKEKLLNYIVHYYPNIPCLFIS